MVTIGKKFGRLANRLWVFSYFIANAIEYGYPLTYRFFEKYIKYFDSTSNNDFLGYPIRARLSVNQVKDQLLFWIHFLKQEYYKRFKEMGSSHEIMRIERTENGYDLNNPDFIRKAQSIHVITREGGFWFNDNVNLKKHADKIRKIFEPKKKYQRNIDTLIKASKLKGDCLIGVHLRKTDFVKAFNGNYYFDDAFYLHQMKTMESLLQTIGKKAVFILSSDEKIIEENFRGTNYILANNHLIEDLYTFAKCDYLIGPPSTYTAWASFYGNVPVYYLENDSISDFTFNNFKIIENVSQIYNLIE